MSNTHTNFVDFYEIMEISPRATAETIENVFRYLARKHHPDVSQDESGARFKLVLQAYEILRDPEKRATFDIDREQHKRENAVIIKGAETAVDDYSERANLLSVFYARRRADMKQPGVSVSRLMELTTCPEEILEFHLWYFKQKGWVEREESGLLSITAEGVDQVENYSGNLSRNLKKIEHHSSRATA